MTTGGGGSPAIIPVISVVAYFTKLGLPLQVSLAINVLLPGVIA
jgi:hypothetical protein